MTTGMPLCVRRSPVTLGSGCGVGTDKTDVLFLEITKSCNYACSHCYLGALPSFAQESATDVARLREALSKIDVLGLREVRFTGGEPLLSRSLPHAVEFCARHGLSYTIVSNGSGISETGSRAMR